MKGINVLDGKEMEVRDCFVVPAGLPRNDKQKGSLRATRFGSVLAKKCPVRKEAISLFSFIFLRVLCVLRG